ncbi:hypothetical protein [Chryseobacterium sp. Leaf394]|uniref:hypothetical protein n=1 Tax=Chryseobacterium sp. Leaf394 TaxID=1736361 RepID=UPI0006F8E5E4|nr:hypothetical protein [Chryseobacterium sp. Leaf394]KQS93806.1 hypothetical protein ASG21_19810 [Chryseobacterium sp. Leaf394]
MSLNIDNFRDEYLNTDKTLKEEYLLVHNYSASLCEIPRNITLLVHKDLSFEIKLVWYKYPVLKRLYSINKSNLIPENIIETINEINEIKKIELKELYTTFNGKYVPDDVSHSSIYFNHNGETHSVNMSSYLMGEKLFINNEEKTILKLHNLLSEWKDKLYEGITEIHK